MITDDAILVNMALDGKREAFDELVRKHRSRVLSTARMLARTADGAEDVAQQAFVAAFANLRLLRDPASFRPWLMTITRRCASRQWTEQSRETTGLGEAMMAFPYYQPVDDSEIRAGVAEMLAELAALSRKIVVMHYLDGCSCREIGESLGMPPGTIKRILHESRSSLRASSELTRGAGEMSQEKQGPRRMEWWISGAEWPHGVMDSVLRQSICLTINKRGLTPEQIAKRVDANEVYVRQELDALEAEELVEKVGRGRYRNTFIAVGAEDWIELSRLIRPKSERVADALAEALPELQAAWESSPKPAQGFDWNTGIWLTLAILVCHYGRVRKGSFSECPEPPLHPASGKRYWSGGRESVTPEPFWSFSWACHFDEGFSHAFLWPTGLGFGRRPWSAGQRVNWSNERRLLLRSIASGSRDIDSAAKAADLDLGKAREAAADAIELGLVEQRQDGLVLTFPVFTSEDDDALLPAVDRVSERIAGVLDPVPRLVNAKLREFGYDHWEKQFCLWQSTPAYEACAEAVRVLYNRGFLPYPGDPAPANFCMWGWFEQKGLFAYHE
jgi:RNA polymerase sigma factor (sigma-70 family)